MASCCLRGSVRVAQNGCAHSLSPRPSLTDLSCAFTQTLASLQPEQSPCLGLCGLNTGCVCGQAGSSCVAAVARVLGRDPAPSQTPASPCGAGPQRDGSACAQRRRVRNPPHGRSRLLAGGACLHPSPLPPRSSTSVPAPNSPCVLNSSNT